MVKLIKFGYFNKKIFLPFGVAIAQILINIMNKTLPEEVKNQPFEMLGASLSQMSISLIPLFKKFRVDSSYLNRKNTNATNKSFRRRSKLLSALHYFVLFLTFGTFLGLNIVLSIQSNIYYHKTKSQQNPHNSGLTSLESLELVFICLVSWKLLKYKYFIHHIISIIIFMLMCFFIDLLVGKFSEELDKGALIISLNITLIILDALDYGYQKYMMEVLYHPYWGITLTIGLTHFHIFIFILVICLVKGKDEKDIMMVVNFWDYFNKVDTGIIVAKHILNFFLNFALNLLRTLTIVHLTPDFILLGFTISRIIDIAIDTGRYECFALFPLQFITLLFYLEIIELNFCSLNKNTRRNIEARFKEEMLLQGANEKNEESLDINSDYTFNIKRQESLMDENENKNTVEMKTTLL